MTTPVNEVVDSLKVRATGAPSNEWPQLSASPANSLWITDSADPLNTSTNAALQISVTQNGAVLEALATDGVTGKQVLLGNAGGVSLVPNGGKVGIGTTTPSQALEVNGAIKATAFLLNNAPIVSSQWSSVTGGISFAGGTVGIDTGANPISRTLHVEGSEIHSGGPGAGFSFSNRGTTAFVDIPPNGERWVWYALSGTARLWSAGDKLAITPTGNVGIGTSTPNGRLDVANLVRFGLDEGNSGPRVITFARDGFDEGNAGKIAYKPGWDRGVLGIVGAGGAPRRVKVWDRLEVTEHLFVLGTDIHLTGRGGGDGNNSGLGRALVDLGRGQGLVVNFANDFGKVQISGPVFASVAGPSDARLKTNITPLTGVLDKLEQIRGVAFEWTGTEAPLTGAAGTKAIGLIAQEVEAVFPELVLRWGENDYRAIDYSRLTSVLIEAVKELRRENTVLTRELDSVKAQLTLLQ